MTHAPDPDQANRPERLVNQLVQDARAQEARMLPAHGELNEHHIAHVRSALAAYCDEHGKKINEIAREMRVNAGTLLRLMQAEYDPMMDDFARRVDRWLKTVAVPDGDPVEPRQMVSTRVTDRMIAIIKAVAQRRAMGIIVGESGTSKTIVLRAVADYIMPESIYMHCVQEAARPGPVIKQLASIMGVSARYRNSESFNRIVESLQAQPRLLLIDQADYLPFKSLNVFRDIHKLTRCPIIFCGTEEINETLRDENALRVQFARLICNRYNINDDASEHGRPLFSTDEVIAYATEMKIKLTLDAANTAADIVNVRDFGGLGRLTFVLLNAHTLARAEAKGKPGTLWVHPHHVLEALRGMDDNAELHRFELRLHHSEQTARKVATA